jgi:hypothetical protein
MDETRRHASPIGDSDRPHETRDVNIRPIALFGAGLFLLTGVVLLLMGWMFGYFSARQARLDAPLSPLAEIRRQPPEPRLQVAPAKELQEIRAAEDAVLSSYGWIDQKAGIVRIPIDRAIELLAERGLPVRPQSKEQQ